jgi:hypothetical protein
LHVTLYYNKTYREWRLKERFGRANARSSLLSIIHPQNHWVIRRKPGKEKDINYRRPREAYLPVTKGLHRWKASQRYGTFLQKESIRANMMHMHKTVDPLLLTQEAASTGPYSTSTADGIIARGRRCDLPADKSRNTVRSYILNYKHSLPSAAKV